MNLKKYKRYFLLLIVFSFSYSNIVAESGNGIAFTVGYGKFLNAKLGEEYSIKNNYAWEGIFSFEHYLFMEGQDIYPSIEFQVGYKNNSFKYTNETIFFSEDNNLEQYSTSDFFSWNRHSLGLIGNLNIDFSDGFNIVPKMGVLYAFNNLEKGNALNFDPTAMYDNKYNNNNWIFVTGIEFKIFQHLSIGCEYEYPLSSVLSHNHINSLPLNLKNYSYLRGLNLSYPSLSLTLGYFIDWKY